MPNFETSVDSDKLTIVVDLSKSMGASKSGKSEVIASSQGNITVPGSDNLKLGLNVYRPLADTTV